MKQLKTWAQWRAKWSWVGFPLILVAAIVLVLGCTLGLTAAVCENFDIAHLDQPC